MKPLTPHMAPEVVHSRPSKAARKLLARARRDGYGKNYSEIIDRVILESLNKVYGSKTTTPSIELK